MLINSAQDPTGTSEIDFSDLTQRDKPRGHVIAARITAENPDEVCVYMLGVS